MQTLWQRVHTVVLGVPVFAKVMGIAFALTLLFGLVMHWEIARTRQRLIAAESTAHGGAEQDFIRQHVGLEAAILGRRLALVMAVTAGVGMAFAWWLARVLTRPLQEVVTGARSIEAGDLRSRVPVRAGDEIGELATAFNRMAAALEEKERGRQKLLRRAIEAGEEERQRLARELHDQTGQLLTALIAGLSALETRATDDSQRAALVRLRELAAQTLGDIHDISRALRPVALDDLGLVAALEKHCATVAERFGKPVEFHSDGWTGTERLPAEIEVALYRIIQEALTNAVRHADATRIQVLAQRKPGAVLVAVEDDGRGFDPVARGPNGDRLGLLGIEERAALLGGSACLESAPGGGTQLFVEIPANDNPHPDPLPANGRGEDKADSLSPVGGGEG
jgi:signal transduction histidine kinase